MSTRPLSKKLFLKSIAMMMLEYNADQILISDWNKQKKSFDDKGSWLEGKRNTPVTGFSWSQGARNLDMTIIGPKGHKWKTFFKQCHHRLHWATPPKTHEGFGCQWRQLAPADAKNFSHHHLWNRQSSGSSTWTSLSSKTFILPFHSSHGWLLGGFLFGILNWGWGQLK